MKYRVKKVEFTDNEGKLCTNYYPQHKHWWSGWHYFGTNDEWSWYDVFDTLEGAINFIKKEKNKRKDSVKYIYLDDECEVIYR